MLYKLTYFIFASTVCIIISIYVEWWFLLLLGVSSFFLECRMPRYLFSSWWSHINHPGYFLDQISFKLASCWLVFTNHMVINDREKLLSIQLTQWTYMYAYVPYKVDQQNWSTFSQRWSMVLNTRCLPALDTMYCSSSCDFPQPGCYPGSCDYLLWRWI